MNKTQHIKDLNITIDVLHAQLESESKLIGDLLKQADKAEERAAAAIDAATKQIAESRKQIAAEKKAATEAATLKSIREGLIPIAVLRDLTGAEYTTEHCQSFTKTNLTVMLNAAKPVDKAILAALLEKPVATPHLHYSQLVESSSPYPPNRIKRTAPLFAPFKVGDKVNIAKPSPDLGYGWYVVSRA